MKSFVDVYLSQRLTVSRLLSPGFALQSSEKNGQRQEKVFPRRLLQPALQALSTMYLGARAQGSLLVGLLKESEGTEADSSKESAHFLRPLSKKRALRLQNATGVDENAPCNLERIVLGKKRRS